MRVLAIALLFLFAGLMPSATGEDRVAAARPRVEPILKEKFRAAGLAYPAGEVFLRVFKREGTVELWARAKASDDFRLIHAYTVTAASGLPGPKRVQGDRQVPEGFYHVDRFNPQSLFHLSLGINYPNASDRILSDKIKPGADIFLHGNALSVGCVPVGDEAIEEIYVATADSRERPPKVHIFPAKMNGADWPAWRDEQTKSNPALGPFWEQLQKGFDLFETNHRLPVVRVEKDGSYRCEAARGK